MDLLKLLSHKKVKLKKVYQITKRFETSLESICLDGKAQEVETQTLSLLLSYINKNKKLEGREKLHRSSNAI